MKTLAISITTLLMIAVAAIFLALKYGGPQPIAALDSINKPFANLHITNLPIVSRFAARDGQSLAYRHYVPSATGISPQRVVLVHGSSASSQSMHLLAQGLTEAGLTVDTLDMRGHGDSGPRGDISYIGQLEDDVDDFLKAIPHAGPSILAGFSAGGGFVLRYAGSARQANFVRYVLLSPYLRYDAPTARPDNGGWVSVGMPRVIALMLLNRLGITEWNHLPVTAFGLNDEARKFLTPSYSYALAVNFAPLRDYATNIANARQPMHLVAGHDDELFYADRFAEVFAQNGTPITVTQVPGVGHMGLILEPSSIKAIVKTVSQP